MTTEEMEEILNELRSRSRNNPQREVCTISGPLLRGKTCTIEMVGPKINDKGELDTEAISIKITNYEIVEPDHFRELIEWQIEAFEAVKAAASGPSVVGLI